MELSEAGAVAPGSPEGHALLCRLRGTGETLTLAGGEWTALAGWVTAARAAGFSHVRAAPGPLGIEVAAARDAGIDGLQVRLYAADPAAHDYHCGAEGSLRATVAMLRAARAAGVPVIVTTPLTRSNMRVLAGLPGLLADVRAAGWRVRVPAATELERRADGPVWGELTPRLAVALPYALQAIVAAERAGVPATLEGAPRCLLGPLGGHALRSPPRAFAAACGECPTRASCPGVDQAYLERHHGDELSPRAVVSQGTGPQRHKLEDMFVGPWLKIGEGACWPI